MRHNVESDARKLTEATQAASIDLITARSNTTYATQS